MQTFTARRKLRGCSKSDDGYEERGFSVWSELFLRHLNSIFSTALGPMSFFGPQMSLPDWMLSLSHGHGASSRVTQTPCPQTAFAATFGFVGLGNWSHQIRSSGMMLVFTKMWGWGWDSLCVLGWISVEPTNSWRKNNNIFGHFVTSSLPHGHTFHFFFSLFLI